MHSAVSRKETGQVVERRGACDAPMRRGDPLVNFTSFFYLFLRCHVHTTLTLTASKSTLFFHRSLQHMRGRPTRGIPETPRKPNAAPHACACGGRPLVRGRVWRHRGARARDACVPPSVGVTEPTPPRGANPMSRSRLMPPGHRTARGGHTPERDVGPAGLSRSALQIRPMRG